MPTALAVMGGAAWCASEYTSDRNGFNGQAPLLRDLWLAFVLTLPVAFAPLSAWARARSARLDFWRRLEQLALAYAVGCASLVASVAGTEGLRDSNTANEWASLLLSGAVMALAGLGVVVARPGTSGRMAGAILVGAGVVMPLAYLASDATVAAALLFFALWGGIAAAALTAHWRGVFQMAVGVIAVRLIILSFELAADLLTSGFGLIVSGVMILGVAWLAVRVSKRFAPLEEPAA